MMDYTAGPGRYTTSEPSLAAHSTPPANSIRARAYAASGMNITAGGPHILLFERDQQLVGLLTSELQLAGYECHTARTAVEVFDAIARYPVRLVLVNLAQAAAARREFWVALDTQRRGRGVQVFTFHCTNLAGYGPATDEVEERSHTVLADMEVDGMLGIMNMVNAIRSRIAVSNTSAMSRLAANTHPTPAPGAQVTAPVPVPPLSTNPAGQVPTGTPFADSPPISAAYTSQPTTSASPSAPTDVSPSRMSPSNPTDKIRAVIYPNQRTWSTSRDNNGGNGQISSVREQQPMQDTNWTSRSSQNTGINSTLNSPSLPGSSSSAVDALSNGQSRRSVNEASFPKESGLAQLSRMLQEHRSPTLEETVQELIREPENVSFEETTLRQRLRPSEATSSLSTLSLRASPIQDMPTDRIIGGQSDTPSSAGTRWPDESVRSNYTPSPSSPALMSITTPPSPVLTPLPTASPRPESTAPVPPLIEEEIIKPGFVEELADNGHYTAFAEELAQREDSNKREHDYAVAEQLEEIMVLGATTGSEPIYRAPDNALLLDIVQSLPLMPSPPPQPQAHQGRATRSLGSVLLAGHLVPQNRLEVAQGIQRMLRGVDMNYQLGEILLMFKLLTPDQLLAASLVSYGLITTTQISSLGRIRQELYAIGLEYDLENLLILFRILTSEQLREVRTSWSG